MTLLIRLGVSVIVGVVCWIFFYWGKGLIGVWKDKQATDDDKAGLTFISVLGLIAIGGIFMGIFYCVSYQFDRDDYVKIWGMHADDANNKIGIVRDADRWKSRVRYIKSVDYFTHEEDGVKHEGYTRTADCEWLPNKYLTKIPKEKVIEKDGWLVETGTPTPIAKEKTFKENMIGTWNSVYYQQSILTVGVFVVLALFKYLSFFSRLRSFVIKYRDVLGCITIVLIAVVGVIVVVSILPSVCPPKNELMEAGDYVRINKRLDTGYDKIGIIQKCTYQEPKWAVRFLEKITKKDDGTPVQHVVEEKYRTDELQRISKENIVHNEDGSITENPSQKKEEKEERGSSHKIRAEIQIEIRSE